jgi:hypothetical protein
VILRDGPDRLSSLRPTYPESPASSAFVIEGLVQHPYGPRAVLPPAADSELPYNRMTHTSNFSYDESDWNVTAAEPALLPPLRRTSEIKYKPDGSRRPLPPVVSLTDIQEASSISSSNPTPSSHTPPSRLPVKTRSQLTSAGSFDISSYYRFSSTVPRLAKQGEITQ